MFTFYMTNYFIAIKFVNELVPDSTPKINIPLIAGMNISVRLSLLMFLL